MWKRHLDIVLDPTHNPQKTKITQHFRPPTTTTTSRQKKKRKAPAFPKKKATPKKKRKIQSTLISFNPPPATIVEPPNVQIDEAIIIAGIRRSERIRNGTLPPHNPPNKKKKVQKKKTKPTPKPTVKPSSKLRSYQEKLHAFFATKNQHPPQPNSHTQSQESPPELSAPLPPQESSREASAPTAQSLHEMSTDTHTRVPPTPSTKFSSYKKKLKIFLSKPPAQPTNMCSLYSTGLKRCHTETPPTSPESDKPHKKKRIQSPSNKSKGKNNYSPDRA